MDLVLNDTRTLLPIEIKAGMTYSKSFADNLQKFTNIAKNIRNPTVIYAGDKEVSVNGIDFKNFRNLSRIFES